MNQYPVYCLHWRHIDAFEWANRPLAIVYVGVLGPPEQAWLHQTPMCTRCALNTLAPHDALGKYAPFYSVAPLGTVPIP
jgi:hypothetical protein